MWREWATVTLALARQSFRLLRTDAAAFAILIFIPLLVIAFTGQAFRNSLVQEGYGWATGAEQSVASMAVLFAFLIVPQTGFLLFREHGWGTWQRLQIAGASLLQIYVGKAVVPLLLFTLQFVALFGYAGLFAGLDVVGSASMLLTVGASYALCVVSLSFLLFAVTASLTQFAAFSNLGAIILSGLGGVFASGAAAPAWLAAVGPLTPGYWAMSGYRGILLGTAAPAHVAYCAAILLCYALLFGVLSLYFGDLAARKEQ